MNKTKTTGVLAMISLMMILGCLSIPDTPEWTETPAWEEDGRLYAAGGPAPFIEAARAMAADNLSRYLGTEFHGKSVSLSEITQKDDRIKTDEQFFQTLIAKSGQKLFDLRAEDNWKDEEDNYWVLISIDMNKIRHTLKLEEE